MPAKDLVIFWPKNQLHSRGTIIGWVNQDEVVVAAVIDCQDEHVSSTLGAVLKKVSNDNILPASAPSPEIIGTWSGSQTSALPSITFIDRVLARRRQQLILYTRPEIHKLRFLSIDPLQLDVTLPRHRQHSLDERNLSHRIKQLQALDISQREHPGSPLEHVMNQLNCSNELHRLVLNIIEPSPYWVDMFQLPSQMLVVMKAAGQHCFTVQQSIIRFVLLICNVSLKVPGSNPTLVKDISATAQQVDVRMEQALLLPHQLRLIQKRDRSDISYSSAQYISFYNFIWLILNDIIIGYALGTFICQNSPTLGEMVGRHLKTWSVDSIRDALVWLDNWPVGLKLNTELSRFFCLTLTGITDMWANILEVIHPYLPIILYIVGASGRSGITMILSMLSDLLSLGTIHIYISYLITTYMFSGLLSVAGSLWRLFRGKRRNVLRNRTDSWDYDLDQLLLGTILFTLLAFLFPTVLVYYALFALARLVIIFFHAGLETLLAFMNHFPLFATMLRLKDPSRLPGGIYFLTHRASGTPYLELKNQPIPLSRIFFQHIRVWSKVSAHYDPRRLLRYLVGGTFITPIQRYKIRYSMVPVE